MTSDQGDAMREALPVGYECGCPVMVENGVWWRVRPRCPEHGEPVKPRELEPLPDGDGAEFWVL